MTGLENFLSIFGKINVVQLSSIVLALLFCWKIYKQIFIFIEHKKQLLIEKYELEKEKDKKINTVLDEVNKYPQYREQSRKIQQEFREEIDELKNSQQSLVKTQQSIQSTLQNMQEKNERRERNKLRDKLLQSYKYYTDKERNPNQTITRMENDAFWELFNDYEDMGGDGYMHTVVQPAMNLLKIIDNL